MVRKSMTRPQVNSITMWVLVAVVGLVPLALGGNRPLIWPITLIFLSTALIANYAALFRMGGTPAVSLRVFRLETAMMGIFLLFATMQVLPLPTLFGAAVDALPITPALSIAPTESFLALITWVNVFILGFLAMQVSRNEQRAVQFMSIIFWVVTIHAAVGFVLFHEFEDRTLIGPKWAYIGSMTGAFVNRNTFGTFLASGAVVGTVLILRDICLNGLIAKEPRAVRALLSRFIAMLLILAVLFGTGSRMGLFVGLVGILLVVMMVLLKQMKGSLGGITILGAGAILTSGLLLLMLGYGGLTMERLGSIDRDVDVRFELYLQTWTMIMDRPWTGFGGGTYELAFPLFHEPGVSVDLLWQKAHNSYLGLWADYGLIFGTLPWLMLLVIVWRLVSIYRRRNPPDFGAIAAIAVALVASLHAIVDFSLEIQGYALLFAAIVGSGAARLSVPLSGKRAP